MILRVGAPTLGFVTGLVLAVYWLEGQTESLVGLLLAPILAAFLAAIVKVLTKGWFEVRIPITDVAAFAVASLLSGLFFSRVLIAMEPRVPTIYTFNAGFEDRLASSVHSLLSCADKWWAFGDQFGKYEGIDYVDATVWEAPDGIEWNEATGTRIDLDAQSRLGVARKNGGTLPSHRSFTGALCVNHLHLIAFGWDTWAGDPAVQDRDGEIWQRETDGVWIPLRLAELGGPGNQRVVGLARTTAAGVDPAANETPSSPSASDRAALDYALVLVDDTRGARCLRSATLRDWKPGERFLKDYYIDRAFYEGGRFVALGHTFLAGRRYAHIFESRDCVRWTPVDLPAELSEDATWRGVTRHGKEWVLIGWIGDRATRAAIAYGVRLRNLRMASTPELSNDSSRGHAIGASPDGQIRAIAHDARRAGSKEPGQLVTLPLEFRRAPAVRIPFFDFHLDLI